MPVFWVTTPLSSPNGKNVGFPWAIGHDLEPANQNDLELLVSRLSKEGIVAGVRLDSVIGPDSLRIIKRRFPCALTVKGIGQLTPPENRLVEPSSK